MLLQFLEQYCPNPEPPHENGGEYDWDTSLVDVTRYNTDVTYSCGVARQLLNAASGDNFTSIYEVVYPALVRHCEWNQTWSPDRPVSVVISYIKKKSLFILEIAFSNYTFSVFNHRHKSSEASSQKPVLDSKFLKASSQKPALKSEFSKVTSHKQVLKNEFSKTSSQKRVLKNEFSKTSSQKRVLKNEFSKTSSQKRVLKSELLNLFY
jgi:hypothetical protein